MTEARFAGFEPFLATAGEILITAHVDPDGDAVGSCLALKIALRHLGKTADVILESALPASLLFLPESDSIRRPAEIGKRYATAFVLDSSSLDRVGTVAEKTFAPDARVAVIDHHW